MDFIRTFFDAFNSIHFPHIGVMDIIEIVVLTVCLYKIILSIINTRIMIVLQGAFICLLAYFIAFICNFNVFLMIFQFLIPVCLFALIMIFQPELRKFLEKAGTVQFSNITWLKDILLGRKKSADILRYSDETIDEICKAVEAMSAVKTGALMVFERDVPLSDFEDKAIFLNADVSSALIINSFEKNTPLHDGAMIIKGNKISSATCYLPLSDNPKINKKFGTRHRAAIGASEKADCFVITVSEETGKISWIMDGEIKHGLTIAQLKEKLNEYKVKQVGIKLKKRGLREMLKHNWVFKTVSVVIAICAWIILMNVFNPVSTRVFSNVPITVENAGELTNLNKTFSFVDYDSVDVSVTLDRISLDSLSVEDIKVVADMSNLSITNSVNLVAYIDKYPKAKVSFVSDSSAKFELDDLVTQEFSITPSIADNSSNDYVYNSAELQTKTVLVTAPKSIIQKIGSVQARADILASDVGYSHKKVGTIFVYDKNGEDITSKVTLSLIEVLLNVSMDAVKEVDLDIDVNSSISSDFRVSKVTYDKPKIRIRGTQSVLNPINNISVELNLPVNDDTVLNEDNIRRETVVLSEYLPDGVSVLKPEDSEIELSIQYGFYSERSVGFNTDDISILNVPDGMSVSFDNPSASYSVSVEGLSTVLTGVSISDLRPYLNLDGATAGGHTYSVQFNIPQDVSISNIPRVRVTLIDRNANVVTPPTHVQEPEPPVVSPPVEQQPELEPVIPPAEVPDSSGEVGNSGELTDSNENSSSGDSVLGSD